MIPTECVPNRRTFLKAGALLATGLSGLALSSAPAFAQDDDSWIVGPRHGYSPEIGTLVSPSYESTNSSLNTEFQIPHIS